MSDQNDGYEVGYGKPPRHTRFTKGQSGNPKGRPKGTKNLSTMLEAAGRTMVNVNLNGQTVRMSKFEASMHQLVNKAAAGDLKAIRELCYWSKALAEREQESCPAAILDENDKPVMESIMKRMLQQFGAAKANDDNKPFEPQEEP